MSSLYEAPYDPLCPIVCVGERPCQLVGEVLAPLPMKPGRTTRQHYEYTRKGICCVLLAFEPRTGWRYLQVRARRTAVDYALFMKELVATYYPVIDRIHLVQDNLNTHTPGAFYEVFAPAEVFALAQKFALHYTPIKGSWINMAERELAAFSK